MPAVIDVKIDLISTVVKRNPAITRDLNLSTIILYGVPIYQK